MGNLGKNVGNFHDQDEKGFNKQAKHINEKEKNLN